MKRRIKKDNERRELLNIPVPESEIMEVAESDTEKDGEDKAAKDDKSKEEGSKSFEHHSRRSPERRRTPPRRRPSPQQYRPYVFVIVGQTFITCNPCCPCFPPVFLSSTSDLASYP